MKYLRFALVGVLFGIILSKGEVISWYRLQEMFRFDSFHMYGVLGSAILLGIIIVALIKRGQWRSLDGESITLANKPRRVPQHLLGGLTFGMGWALTGACPGPMYILIGNGFSVAVVMLASAILGTFVYGRVQHLLPH